MTPVYSNFDHQLDLKAVEYLRTHPNEELPHYAWNFASWICFDGTKFRAKVMQYHMLSAELENDSIEGLIAETNERFGSE